LQNAEINNGIVDVRKFLYPLFLASKTNTVKELDDNWFSPTNIQPQRKHRHKSNEDVLPQPNQDIFMPAKVADHAIVQNPEEIPIKVNNHRSYNHFPDKYEIGGDLDESPVFLTEYAHEDETPFSRESSYDLNDDPNITSIKRNREWYNNFNRLDHALRHYHPHQKNELPLEDVKRMISNYNLIYKLGFTQHQMSAIKQSLSSSKKHHGDQLVAIDRILGLLQSVV